MGHLHLFVARLCATSPEDEAIVRNPFVDPAPQYCFVLITGDSVMCSGITFAVIEITPIL
ncbi:predicted protein [Botrytis cinerea T4]|uniref:Uncharacterized protein n=1 Tax=Botryotinia fuckeliana (strain T4) TaxID=999810 RepID=G2XWM7_BOTF4|nr:predicted protein [Botrytis cinerea T4]